MKNVLTGKKNLPSLQAAAGSACHVRENIARITAEIYRTLKIDCNGKNKNRKIKFLKDQKKKKVYCKNTNSAGWGEGKRNSKL